MSGKLVHISAIGADANAKSDYARTKAEGEASVLAAYPDAVILRPSVIFGTEDEFFNRFGKMAEKNAVMMLVGGNTKFQPVYVDDVAQAAVKAVLGQAEAGVYELGGPDVDTLKGLMGDMLEVVHRDRIIVNLPFWLGGVIGGVLSLVQTLTFGLFHNGILTRDQVANLKVDNVVSGDVKTFDDLGIKPTALQAVLPDYMWVFRPSGQYDAIRESGKKLHKV